jgi:hypothetical protein
LTTKNFSEVVFAFARENNIPSEMAVGQLNRIRKPEVRTAIPRRVRVATKDDLEEHPALHLPAIVVYLRGYETRFVFIVPLIHNEQPTNRLSIMTAHFTGKKNRRRAQFPKELIECAPDEEDRKRQPRFLTDERPNDLTSYFRD